MSLTWRKTSPCSEITTCGRYALHLYARENMPGGTVLYSTRSYACTPGAPAGTPSTVLGVSRSRDREVVLTAGRQICEDHAAGVASEPQTTGEKQTC